MSRRDLSKPLRHVDFEVNAEESGMRLDQWLHSRVSWRSRTDLQARIQRGSVLVDGKPARKSTKVQAGQIIRIEVDEGPATREVPAAEIPLDVIFEDSHMIVLDKPPGVIVHPVGGHVMDTILNALHVRFHEREHARDEEPPMIVHRLDRDTSGVLVLAKNETARRILGRDFEERRVQKTYLALVKGSVTGDSGAIDGPIGPDTESDNRLKVAVVPDGKPSRTEYVVVARSPECSLVRCFPKTGRQHQIRVHLASLGHPLLCDSLYGNAGSLGPLERHALHAERLVLAHPASGQEMIFEAPLAEDLQTFLRLSDGMEFRAATPEPRPW